VTDNLIDHPLYNQLKDQPNDKLIKLVIGQVQYAQYLIYGDSINHMKQRREEAALLERLKQTERDQLITIALKATILAIETDRKKRQLEKAT
jgi:hypothetical protein